MAWLVEHAPLLIDPPLATWITERLVEAQRIMRLRRGVYLVPDHDGRLPSLARAMNLLEPDGYISGHAALSAQGLNDQDVSHWWAVGTRRQADITYGRYLGHFVFSPASARTGLREAVRVEGEPVTMATATQALVDEARLMPFGFDWIETARVLRNAAETGRTDEVRVLRVLERQPSLAALRRLGLLFELVRGAPDAHLLGEARHNLTLSRITGDSHVDPTWRITLPFDRSQISRAMK